MPGPLYRAGAIALSGRTVRNWRTGERYRVSLLPLIARRAVFVHIPKAAGVSVAVALFGGLGGGHRSLRGYEQVLGERRLRRYFKFTFVRNPFERLLSSFHFLQLGGMTMNDARWARRFVPEGASFEWFVLEQLQLPEVRRFRHFRAQTEFLVDAHGAIGVDFTGRYERLADDFAAICSRLGIRRELPRLNVTEAQPGRDVRWSGAMVDVVRQLYRRDFDLLGYADVPPGPGPA